MSAKKLENLKKAFKDLEESIVKPVEENRDLGGIVKAFEIVFELSWKYLQELNENSGNPSRGPRESLEKAYENKFIEEDLIWVEALKDRNLTVHIYDHKFATEMVERIKTKYIKVFKALISF